MRWFPFWQNQYAKRPSLRLITGLVLAFASASGVQASPATDLFSTATRTIKEQYFGWDEKNFSLLAGDYAQKLQEVCADQPDTCSYEQGRKVLGQLLDDFGDLHTNVRDPEAAQRLREIMQDMAVLRTGLRTVRAEGGLLVVSVMPGSPAEAQGLRRFDLLTEVQGQAAGKRNGQNTAVGPNDLLRLERIGAPIPVTLRRAGQADQSLNLQTASLKARDVPALNWVGTGHQTALIDLPSFLAADTSKLFLQVVQQAQRQGAKQLIIDLRYNGGGSLSQCVAAASIFGPTIYDTQFMTGSYTYTGLNGQTGHYLQVINAPATQKIWTGPASILMGPNTASCAEVFGFFAHRAGATLVGETTKGVGNSGVLFHDLPDGSLLAVTVLRAYDAQGNPLPDHLTPDVLAPTDIPALTQRGLDTTLQAALSALAQSTAAH